MELVRQEALEICDVVAEFGLRPARSAEVAARAMTPDDLGVVSYQVVRETT